MAIIIPSKSIYDKENPKVLKNAIEKIEINSYNVVQKQQFETTVFSDNIYITESELKIENLTAQGELKIQKVQEKSYVAVALLSNDNGYYEKTITIPKTNNNALITQLKEQDYFKYSLYGKVRKRDFSAEYNYDTDSVSNFQYGEFSQTEGQLQLPEMPIKANAWASGTSVLATISGLGDTTEISYTEDFDNYYFKVKILAYVVFKRLTGNLNISFTRNTTLTGTNEEYIASKLTIQLLGNLIEIDLQNETVKLHFEGKANSKNVFSVEGNELMQTTSYTQTGENSIVKNYGKTLNEYANGKETATLLCSISDYYDEENKLTISKSQKGFPMTFNRGDEVIPMIMNNKGADVPMSKDKVFVVIGNDIYYDGAVWQRITLLQK